MALPPGVPLEELMEMPAMEAPEGVTPNFVDPPNRNGMVNGVLTMFTVISTLCICLRMYAKVYVMRKMQLQEIMALIAWVIYIAQLGVMYRVSVAPGYYVHQYNLKMKDMVEPTYLIMLIGNLYQVSLPMIKAAIMIDWLHILQPPGNKWKSPFFVGCMIIIVLQPVSALGLLTALNLQCRPYRAIWEFWVPRECYELIDVQLSSCAVQLFTDFSMLVLPQKSIWDLQLSWQKKMGVSLVFSLGLLACIAAAFRLNVTLNFGADPDQMFALGPLIIWVAVEGTCAFFIISMPCLPKILKDHGVSRKIKLALGMKVSTTDNTYGSQQKTTKYGLGSKYGTATDRYQQLDEESGVPLEQLKSESTEQLRGPEKHDGQIMRTTHVTVQVSGDEDAHTAPNGQQHPGSGRSNWKPDF